MTVSTVVNHEQYDGNGVTTVFSYRFRVLKSSHMVVTVSDPNGATRTLTPDVDYTVNGVGLVAGGDVTLNAPLPGGWKISLDRDLPAVQETDLRNQGRFFAETHEDAFDYLTMLVQRNLSLYGMALRKPSWLANYYDAQGNRIANLADPAAPQDAATRAFTLNEITKAVIASSVDMGSLANTTSDALGDALIGVKQPTPSAAPTNQHNKNLQSVCILDYGNPRAKDDYTGTSGTNCLPALLGIMADFPDGCVIRMPRSVGGTGRYYMNGSASSSDMSKFVIDADPGVDITHDGANTPLIGPGLRVVRPLSIKLVTLGYTYSLSATAHGQVASKPYIMSQGDGEAPIVERLITSEPYFYFNTVNLSNGGQTGISATADGETASFANIPTGGFTVGSVPIRPGQEVHAQVSMPNMTGDVAAYIQTENGWIIISQNLAGGTYTRRVYLEGYAIQVTNISDPLADNPAYQFWASEIGIRVHSPTSFSLLMNHVEVLRMTGITSNIIRAGWGAGLANNTNPAYITYPVKIRDAKTFGMRPLKIVVVGDSTADKNNPFSWVNHMVRCASGAGGVQFRNILNLAVAGQTSVQQAAIFNAQNFQALGGFDYALIDIGINDIGGAVPVAQFISSIVSMINTCNTYNITPIIGLPALFYNQSAAAPYGQTGQNSANADRGAPYRLQLLRKLAELDIQVALLPLSDMGAIVPSLLSNPSLNPVVQDNVHQSNFGAELKGQGWAKAFIGNLFRRIRTEIAAKDIKPAWIPSAISASYGVSAKPKYEIIGNEFGLLGLMDTPASVPDGTVVLQLPAAYAPRSQIYAPLVCQDSSGAFIGTCTGRFDTTGAIAVRGVPATSRYIFFGNCRYSLQQ